MRLEVTQINYHYSNQQAWFHISLLLVSFYCAEGGIFINDHRQLNILVKTLFMFCNWLETFILSFSFYQFDM